VAAFASRLFSGVGREIAFAYSKSRVPALPVPSNVFLAFLLLLLDLLKENNHVPGSGAVGIHP
jgi:hypothetical protein